MYFKQLMYLETDKYHPIQVSILCRLIEDV